MTASRPTAGGASSTASGTFRALTAVIKNRMLEAYSADFMSSSWTKMLETMREAAHPSDFHMAYPPNVLPIPPWLETLNKLATVSPSRSGVSKPLKIPRTKNHSKDDIIVAKKVKMDIERAD